MGASIIEKHFTLDRSGGGPDDSFSLQPAELAALCQGAKTAWSALGQVDYGRKSSEQGNIRFRRSLYYVRAMSPGDVITHDCIKSVRPGFGIEPKYMSNILGKIVTRRIEKNTGTSWGDFE
jgi:N-acetylneuraminate synthase